MTTIRVWRRATNSIDVLELEDYVAGVLPREMSTGWPTQALCAQAVAARTYALAAIAHPRYPPNADLDDTARTQAYVDARYADTTAAVQATAGETWPGDCLYVSYCGRPDCPLCKGTGGYNGQTWTGRLCQWGARFMALRGDSYHQILALYYADSTPVSNSPSIGAIGVSDYSAYPRPPHSTGAGVHGGANGSYPLGETTGKHVADFGGMPVYDPPLSICQQWTAMGLGWVKLLTIDDTVLKVLPTVLYAQMMPVIRVYFDRPTFSAYSAKQQDTLRQCAALGAFYVEDDNERNLDCEWPVGQWPGDANAMPFAQLVAAWAQRAQFVHSKGMRLAVPALSPGGNWKRRVTDPEGDDIGFLVAWLKAAKANPLAWQMLQGTWVSVHNAALSHPLDYPDDAVNQADHPGQTIHMHYYANGNPTGASNSYRKWEAVHQLVKDTVGLDLPVLCTEGGVWPGKFDADPRYAALSDQEASDRQATVLRSMQTAPAYLLAQMPWLWADKRWGNTGGRWEAEAWYRVPGFGTCPAGWPEYRPVVAALKAAPCEERQNMTVGETIAELAQKHVLPLNPAAALEKAGAALGYLPASDEFPAVVAGVTYVAQAFRDPAHLDVQHVAYAIVGQWENISWQARLN